MDVDTIIFSMNFYGYRTEIVRQPIKLCQWLCAPGPSSNSNRRNIFPCRQGYRVDSPLKSARRDRSSAATKKNFHDNFFLLRPMLLFFIVSI